MAKIIPNPDVAIIMIIVDWLKKSTFESEDEEKHDPPPNKQFAFNLSIINLGFVADELLWHWLHFKCDFSTRHLKMYLTTAISLITKCM